MAEYVEFPAMIKPNLSAGAKGITKVENMEELEEQYPPIAEVFGACTLQQYVEQPDYYYKCDVVPQTRWRDCSFNCHKDYALLPVERWNKLL